MSKLFMELWITDERGRVVLVQRGDATKPLSVELTNPIMTQDEWGEWDIIKTLAYVPSGEHKEKL